MKKVSLFFLALLTAGFAFGQGKQVVNGRLSNNATHKAKLSQELKVETIVNAKQIQDFTPTPGTGVSPYGVNAVSPVELGRASNAFTILRTEQNQVYANDSLDMVSFIHRHDVTIYGGGSAQNGKYRYDISTDGGATFTNDQGVLNNTYTRPARYPNITMYNPAGNSNPLMGNMVYSGPTLDPSPSWDGHVTGVSDVTTGGTTTGTENYNFIGMQTLLPGGLCQGLPGEFWTVDFQYDGTNTLDSLFVYKGTWNSGTSDVDWTRSHSLFPGHDKSIDGSVSAVGPVISFSPDGQTGWIAFLGDITGSPTDSAFHPILIKSGDAGATWDAAVEVDINAASSWVYDTLRSLWTDSLGNPASSGEATCAFDLDLTVDANGNPHIAAVVGTKGTGQAYSIAGTAKFMADITSTDGGTTWDVIYVGPVLTLRGEFGTPDPTDGSLLSMDNFCQISRNQAGTHIFYSWVDSDTTVIGFGEADNLAPNLRVSGYRISDGYQTCYKLVSDGDFVWDGKLLFPTMAPEVITDGSTYKLPIVALDMITNDQLQPCKFWYYGGDATLTESDFQDPSSLSLAWGSTCTTVSNDVKEDVPAVAHGVYPNPTAGNATIKFELPASATVKVSILNMYGQEVMNLANNNFAAGVNEVEVNTSSLAAGVYFYSLQIADKNYTNKMVVVK